MRAFALAALSLLMTSCITASFVRTNANTPIPDQQHAHLEPGVDLGECLSALGAPILVVRTEFDDIVLAWGWLDEADWGVSIQTPSVRSVSISFDWDEEVQHIQGLVLRFDQQLKLQDIRRGRLSDLLPPRF